MIIVGDIAEHIRKDHGSRVVCTKGGDALTISELITEILNLKQRIRAAELEVGQQWIRADRAEKLLQEIKSLG